MSGIVSYVKSSSSVENFQHLTYKIPLCRDFIMIAGASETISWEGESRIAVFTIIRRGAKMGRLKGDME